MSRNIFLAISCALLPPSVAVAETAYPLVPHAARADILSVIQSVQDARKRTAFAAALRRNGADVPTPDHILLWFGENRARLSINTCWSRHDALPEMERYTRSGELYDTVVDRPWREGENMICLDGKPFFSTFCGNFFPQKEAPSSDDSTPHHTVTVSVTVNSGQQRQSYVLMDHGFGTSFAGTQRIRAVVTNTTGGRGR